MVATSRARQIVDALVTTLNADALHTVLWGETGAKFYQEMYPGQKTVKQLPSVGIVHSVEWDDPLGKWTLNLTFYFYGLKLEDPIRHEDVIAKMMPHVAGIAREYDAIAKGGGYNIAIDTKEAHFVVVNQRFEMSGGY